jgi:hypothetical protein
MNVIISRVCMFKFTQDALRTHIRLLEAEAASKAEANEKEKEVRENEARVRAEQQAGLARELANLQLHDAQRQRELESCAQRLAKALLDLASSEASRLEAEGALREAREATAAINSADASDPFDLCDYSGADPVSLSDPPNIPLNPLNAPRGDPPARVETVTATAAILVEVGEGGGEVSDGERQGRKKEKEKGAMKDSEWFKAEAERTRERAALVKQVAALKDEVKQLKEKAKLREELHKRSKEATKQQVEDAKTALLAAGGEGAGKEKEKELLKESKRLKARVLQLEQQLVAKKFAEARVSELQQTVDGLSAALSSKTNVAKKQLGKEAEALQLRCEEAEKLCAAFKQLSELDKQTIARLERQSERDAEELALLRQRDKQREACAMQAEAAEARVESVAAQLRAQDERLAEETAALAQARLDHARLGEAKSKMKERLKAECLAATARADQLQADYHNLEAEARRLAESDAAARASLVTSQAEHAATRRELDELRISHPRNNLIHPGELRPAGLQAHADSVEACNNSNKAAEVGSTRRASSGRLEKAGALSRPASGQRKASGSGASEVYKASGPRASTPTQANGGGSAREGARSEAKRESLAYEEQQVILEAQGRQIWELRTAEAALRDQVEDLTAQLQDVSDKGRKAELTTVEYIQKSRALVADANQRIAELTYKVESADDTILTLRDKLFHCHCGATGTYDPGRRKYDLPPD